MDFFLRSHVGNSPPSVTPGQFKLEQSILGTGPLANVVNDEVPRWIERRELIADDHDVWEIFWNDARDEIAGAVVGGVLRDGQVLPAALEKRHQIQHAPMVDVGIGFPQAPMLRIGGPGPRHVFVDFLLQIEAHPTESADRHIAAHAAFERHIAAGILERGVGRIVRQRLSNLGLGRDQKSRDLRWTLGRQQRARNDERGEDEDKSDHVGIFASELRLAQSDSSTGDQVPPQSTLGVPPGFWSLRPPEIHADSKQEWMTSSADVFPA